MQKHLFIFLIALGVFGFSQAHANVAKQETIIIDEITQISVNPNDYMNASSVEVQLLDNNGNILSRAQTAPGQAVSLPVSSGTHVHIVRAKYRVDQVIIITDVIEGA